VGPPTVDGSVTGGVLSVKDVSEFERDASTPGPVATEFVALSRALLDATTVHAVLQRVATAALAVVTGADMVSVTLRTPDGRFETPVETLPLAVQLDELQYRFDEGPCVEATRTPGPGLISSCDLAAGTDFPLWGPAAAAAGVGSVLAVGLFPDGGSPRLGALNFYSFTTTGLDDGDRDIAMVLAAHASTALAATRASTTHEIRAAQLQEALRSRDVIGQAKGILMERRGITAEEAFDVLRAASQSLNVKLAKVAETLATRRAEI
jgi:GAF domain-containing protein